MNLTEKHWILDKYIFAGVSLIQYNLNCVHFCFIYIIFYDEMHFSSMQCKRVTAVVLVHGHTIIYIKHYNLVICKSLSSTPQPVDIYYGSLWLFYLCLLYAYCLHLIMFTYSPSLLNLLTNEILYSFMPRVAQTKIPISIIWDFMFLFFFLLGLRLQGLKSLACKLVGLG